MTQTAPKYKSHIQEAIHETASGLYRAGVITKNQMAEFDARCLEPVPAYSQKSVQKLRRKLKLSQSVLAHVLNTSTSTVQKWENGDKVPSGPSAKLLHLLESKGLEVLL